MLGLGSGQVQNRACLHVTIGLLVEWTIGQCGPPLEDFG